MQQKLYINRIHFNNVIIILTHNWMREKFEIAEENLPRWYGEFSENVPFSKNFCYSITNHKQIWVSQNYISIQTVAYLNKNVWQILLVHNTGLDII